MAQIANKGKMFIYCVAHIFCGIGVDFSGVFRLFYLFLFIVGWLTANEITVYNKTG